MDNFCRGCLTKHEPMDLLQYTEKNRRLFVYSTGLQVKRTDAFVFQLCKECCVNMKTACYFKKTCRNSDKKLKNYLENKETGDNTDIVTFLKNDEDSFKLRLPNVGSSTPAYTKNKDDDNESTCTSIQNFMTDILPVEEIPDSEARIICEVIEEEADILEDSLDSHWLQEEVSVDSDFGLEYNFSPFSIPRSINNELDSPKKSDENTQEEKIIKDETEKCTINLDIGKAVVELSESFKTEADKDIEEKKCIIDANLENALKNANAEKVMLDDILLTPPVLQNISAPPTPLITNILFGEQIDDNSISKEDTNKNNVCQEDIDVLDEFLKINDNKQKSFEYEDSLISIDEIENIQTFLNKNPDESESINETNKEVINRVSSPIDNKYCITNFYCKMCERQFKNLVALKVHCTKYHKLRIHAEKRQRVRKKYICDYCGKTFMSSRCITKHLANHQTLKTYDCEKCNLKFSSEARLGQHLSIHTGIRTKKDVPKNYICSICGAICSSSSNYNIHKRRHLNKFTINCEECGKGFYRTSDLTIHMRYHTGEKPYACSFCPQRFARQDTLSRHMKRHNGEKPFTCQFCDAKFCKSYDLKLHHSRSKQCLEQQRRLAEKTQSMQDILLVNTTCELDHRDVVGCV